MMGMRGGESKEGDRKGGQGSDGDERRREEGRKGGQCSDGDERRREEGRKGKRRIRESPCRLMSSAENRTLDQKLE